ncbi:hypothetical protein PCASD_22777 [Puccinia coronata f. sp. avenae]|uniref:Uncharacterized protein n=1 Tax=Puccinia coronata f. sp. avenae TaxID=200324 RepID=A0A2N5TJD4_9BASI|nr:hypothetical protein PCASD_22777 [Puccinia coronata f. sp. avenae]
MLNKHQFEHQFLSQLLGGSKIEEYNIPIIVKADLGQYQRDRIRWLAFLAKYQLLGILCDDGLLQDGTQDAATSNHSFSQVCTRASKSSTPVIPKSTSKPRGKTHVRPVPHLPGKNVPNLIALQYLEALSLLAWTIVLAVDMENIGVPLDSLNTLACEWADLTVPGGIQLNADTDLRKSISELSNLLGTKIFLPQMGDGAWVATPLAQVTAEMPALMSWSRSSYFFLMESDRGGYLPMGAIIEAVVMTAYAVPWCLDISNTSQRAPAESTQITAMAFETLNIKEIHYVYKVEVKTKTAQPPTNESAAAAPAVVTAPVAGAVSSGPVAAIADKPLKAVEAHGALAITMNSFSGKSNAGKDGEDASRFLIRPNGDKPH